MILKQQRGEIPFSMVPWSVLNDTNLSWKAKGLLAYLLGKPSGWKVQTSDLVSRGSDGEDSVRSGLKEIREAHYGRLVCVRSKGAVKEWEFTVSDTPNLEPEPNNQTADNPDVESADLNMPDISKKDCSKNESNKEEVDFPIPENLNSAEFLSVWEQWIKHRKEIRHTLTPTTAKLQLRKLDEMGLERAINAITFSISNGWQGIFEPVYSKQNPPPNAQYHRPSSLI